ncbi:MAG TPA: 50S ribosomal protein L20 [Candidatus Paceibacterota bacterium]|nr:50S ribosomal protein L20 [Candidatus Paceibacterota bacterium]
MARVKRGTLKNKRRKYILAQTKGYRFDRKSKERVAKEAIKHAGTHAFRHRRAKKREFRNLWALRINAAARPLGFSYSKLIGALKKKNIALDRKSLAALAKDYPDAFAAVIRSL